MSKLLVYINHNLYTMPSHTAMKRSQLAAAKKRLKKLEGMRSKHKK